MKFIIPQNYKFNSKLFGILDAQVAFLNVIWDGANFLIVNTLFKALNIKIFIFIILALPVLIFSIVGVNGEKIVDVIIFIIKFILRRKILFFDKK